MNLSELEKALGKYGKVVQCEIIEDKLHVRLDEFKNGVQPTLELSQLIIKKSGNEWPVISSVNVDEGYYSLVLKKASDG